MSDGPEEFTSWRDVAAYLVAEAQLLLAALLVALGLGLTWFNPSLPGIPAWVGDLLIGWLVMGPPAFIFGLKYAGWLRSRRMVEVQHVNAAEDVLKTWFVPPQVWSEKHVFGPAPYRVNDGDSVAVREFEWHPDKQGGTLVVRGVYLEELEDAKLFTSQKHAERMYDELVDAYLSLAYLRESIGDLAASLQTRLINEVVYAREQGEQLDKTAITSVTEEFEERAEAVTEAEVTELSDEDVPDYRERMETDTDGESVEMETEASGGEQTAAADGGTQE